MSNVKWFYSQNNEQRGPVTQEQLMSILGSGQISASSLVWHKGLAGWTPANQCPELNGQSAYQPAPSYAQPAAVPQNAPAPSWGAPSPGPGGNNGYSQPAPSAVPGGQAQYGQVQPAPVYQSQNQDAELAAGDLGDLVSQAMEKRKRQQEAEAQKAYDERWQERVRQGESRAAAAPKRAAAATGPRVVRPAANFFYLVAFITCSFGIYTLSTGKSLLRGDQGGSHAEIIGGAIGMIIGGLLYALCAFFGRTVGWVYICGIVLYLLDAIVMLFSGNIGGIVIRVLIASWLIRGYAGRPEN